MEKGTALPASHDDPDLSCICYMASLTKAEEQVMQALWELGPCFVKDLVAAMPEPRPAYTTVSTIIRILEEKGHVGQTETRLFIGITP